MNIGEPQREILVEPPELPEPLRSEPQPEREPAHQPSQPEKEPVNV